MWLDYIKSLFMIFIKSINALIHRNFGPGELESCLLGLGLSV